MKSESIPMAQEAESPLSPAEIEVLRRQFVKEGEYVTIQTKFNYAWSLIRSADRQQIGEGIQLLTEIFHDSPERRRECLYYLAIGHYKIGNYSEARKFNLELLKHEPRNEQARDLDRRIDEKVSKEGAIGLAIVGGVVTVGAALLAAIVKRSRH
ncbi:mitochondrial fission 1 protein [Zychaea mexicana]|uniref:mitochondrial fission 1 protein n=1 Tax=Zychaea mexicana TaxID=64656 RepID=UPI0022FDB2FF|nr:mitochondrial fission 1 protein [Zychaea mexicana]KAI9490973.1 mitochondrial fission 1 protein [Zychaea mexicana]